MKTKHLIASVAAASLLLGFAISFANPNQTNAYREPGLAVHVETIKDFHGLGKNCIDIDFTVNKTFTPTASSALVYRLFNNNNTNQTIFSFVVNGVRTSGTSANPSHCYTYTVEGEHTSTYNLGGYACGYVHGSRAARGNYSYLIVPTSNFSTLPNDTESTLTEVSLEHRMNSDAGNSSYKQLNYDVHGIYLLDSFTPEESFDPSDLEQIYSPAAGTFAVTPFSPSSAYDVTEYVSATLEDVQNAYDYEITLDPEMQHGSVYVNKDGGYDAGDTLTFRPLPAAGYELDHLYINEEDVTDQMYSGFYPLENANYDITVSASFKAATEYRVEEGTMVSSYQKEHHGTAYTPFDAANVMVTKYLTDIEASDLTHYVGITTDAINQEVGDAKFIAVDIHMVSNEWRTFYVEINGVRAASGKNYIVDRLGDMIEKEAVGAVVENATRFANSTWTQSAKTEGFSGTIILPLSRWEGLETIQNVSVYSFSHKNSYARFDVGKIRLLDSLNPVYAPRLTDEQVIWAPTSETNFTPYGDTLELAQVKFMKAGQVDVYGIDANPGYDAYYVAMPTNMIGDDGYVDLASLGIKGVAIDFENTNDYQEEFRMYVFGDNSPSASQATNRDGDIWITSIGAACSAQFVADNGIIRTRRSGYIPYDYDVDGNAVHQTAYYPISPDAFVGIGANNRPSFPTKIQPLLRFHWKKDTPKDGPYSFGIKNIRFITDDSAFNGCQVTITGIGADLKAMVGNKDIAKSTGIAVVPGTTIDFTVTPKLGYDLSGVTYTMGGNNYNPTIDSNGRFSVEVTSDITVVYRADEREYHITYNLDGGVNNEYNPTSFYLSSGEVTLYDPTKEGYEFIGWIDEEGNEVESIDSSIARDITLTARWRRIGGDEPPSSSETPTSSDTPVTPTPDKPAEDGAKQKGCGGAILTTVIASGISLVTIGGIAFLRRKRK